MAWIFDVTTDKWTSGPRLLTPRARHGCFHIKYNNIVTQIVVMGGVGSAPLSSTEVLDVSTMTWSIGPPLPTSFYDNRGVQSVDDSYLGFSTGGYGNSKRQNQIIGLKRTNKDFYSWEYVHSMTTPRNAHSVVNAPGSFLPNC